MVDIGKFGKKWYILYYMFFYYHPPFPAKAVQAFRGQGVWELDSEATSPFRKHPCHSLAPSLACTCLPNIPISSHSFRQECGRNQDKPIGAWKDKNGSSTGKQNKVSQESRWKAFLQAAHLSHWGWDKHPQIRLPHPLRRSSWSMRIAVPGGRECQTCLGF